MRRLLPIRVIGLWLGCLVGVWLSGCERSSVPSASISTGRFVKVDRQGHELADDQGPWACVLDRQTQLLWENKTDNETWHYGTATFSWYRRADHQGVAEAGTCMQDQAQVPCDTQKLVDALNKERLCGYASWRLPQESELRSLIFKDAMAGDPLILKTYFPFTDRAPYWSTQIRESRPNNETEGLTVNFADGASLWLPVRLAARARLVTAAQPTATQK